MKKQFRELDVSEEKALDQAWQEIEGLFVKSKFVEAEPGFSRRWHARAQRVEEQMRQMRTLWAWAGFVLGLTAMALVAMLSGQSALLFSLLISLTVTLSAVSLTFYGVLVAMADAIPLSLWLSAAATCALVLIGWAALFNWAQIERD